MKARAQDWVAAGIKPLDALHVSCAEVAKADVFLTTDDRLLRAARHAGLARLAVNNPLPWLSEVLTS